MTVITQRIIEAVNQKEDLAAFLNDLFQNYRANSGLIGQSIGALAQLFQVARDGGANVSQGDPAMTEFLSGSFARMTFELQKNINSNAELAGKQISGIVSALNTARSTGTTWVIPQAPAMRVDVIGMPERVTSTEIKRDPKTNAITGSAQIERDVAACPLRQ